MCERAMTAAIEAAMLLGQARDEGRISRSDYNDGMATLSQFTAGLIVDSDNPAATFRDFLHEMRRLALAAVADGGHA